MQTNLDYSKVSALTVANLFPEMQEVRNMFGLQSHRQLSSMTPLYNLNRFSCISSKKMMHAIHYRIQRVAARQHTTGNRTWRRTQKAAHQADSACKSHKNADR